jgi:DNA-binding MarR family transcriptional regulator
MMSTEAMLRELKKISKILTLTNASSLEKELEKIASTNDRKKMWVLIDGNRRQKEIAVDAGVTQAAVSYFLSAAVAAELIEYPRGEPPRRIVDYVPPSWIELAKLPPAEETEKTKQAKLETTVVGQGETKEGKENG